MFVSKLTVSDELKQNNLCGYLSEVNVGFENGKEIKEFHLTGKEPDFDHRGVREALRKKKELSVKPVVLADAVEKAFEPATILIKKGQMTITITGVDVADAVNKLLK